MSPIQHKTFFLGLAALPALLVWAVLIALGLFFFSLAYLLAIVTDKLTDGGGITNNSLDYPHDHDPHQRQESPKIKHPLD